MDDEVNGKEKILSKYPPLREIFEQENKNDKKETYNKFSEVILKHS